MASAATTTDVFKAVAEPRRRQIIDLLATGERPVGGLTQLLGLAQGDVATEVAQLKAGPGDGVVSAGGAGFAATLIQLDLIDEYRMFLNPVVLGAGTPYFPPLDHRLGLELLETRTFGSRVVYHRYQRPGR